MDPNFAKRLLFAVLLCLGAFGLLPTQGVVAQSAIAFEFDEGSRPMERRTVFNARECSSNLEIGFTLRGGVPDTGQVIFYRGTSCNLVEKRDGGDTEDCERLEAIVARTVAAEMDYTVNLGDLELCQDNRRTTTNLFAMAVMNTDMPSEDVMDNYGSIEITVDTQAPTAPAGLEVGAGDTSIPVDWTQSEDTELQEYKVYLDPDGCSGGSLMAGMAPPSSLLVGTTAIRANNFSINGEERGIEYGQEVGVGITVLDEADNESVLSQVVCTSRVQVDGFCERRGGCPEGACSVSSSFDLSGGFLALIALFGLTLRRRS